LESTIEAFFNTAHELVELGSPGQFEDLFKVQLTLEIKSLTERLILRRNERFRLIANGPLLRLADFSVRVTDA
jgi:hypothetical protein